jgi:HEAT repeat protein/beta-lactamase regulating signal transducer with metallopeptidase domain
MIDAISSAVLAWLLTYLIHSTALLLLALALTRARVWAPAASDLLWKMALVGGLLSASVQLRLELRPVGSVSLPSVTRTATASVDADARDTGVPTASLAEQVNPTKLMAREAHAPASPTAAPSTPSLPLPTLIVMIWALGALGLVMSYVARRLILVGRIGDRRAVVDGLLLVELEQLVRGAKLRRRVRLTSTARISSPIALGVAEICLPESALTELDLEQQRSMLAHELAHLARRDPLWLAFASVVERVLWIQPLNRLARRGIATAAEYLADEWAVGRTGSGVALARCLAQVAEWIQASPLGVPVAGMAEERSLLVSRVEKLLSGQGPRSRSNWMLAIASTGVVLATIVMVPGVTGRSARASNVYGIAADSESSDRSLLAKAGASIASTDNAAHDTRHSTADSTVVLALIGRLKDEDADVRAAAAQSLGKLEDARAVPGLVAALSDREAKVRAAAAEALGKFEDPRAVSGLSALLADAELDVRKQALEALSSYESGVPASAVIRLLADPDAELRQSAAHALGHLGDRSAGAALAPLVRDPSPDVRQAAIEALAELHDVAHASAIVPALNDASPDVRQQALGALADLRSSIPDATLLALLRDPNADVRGRAAALAGERSVSAAIPALRAMLEDADRQVRMNAVSALGNIADDAAIDALRAGLGSKDAGVRREAAGALGERRQ